MASAPNFAGGVLVFARAMEGGIRFGLGATIATTKTVLGEIGGLDALVEYLGDDYELGARAAAAGYKVEVPAGAVPGDQRYPTIPFGDFWAHQMRWAPQYQRSPSPAQYVGLIVTFGLVWAVIAVLLNPLTWWTWLTLVVTGAARLTAALIVGRDVLGDPRVLPDLWLLPLHDLIALLIWIVCYAGNKVEWRGLQFKLRNGKLEKI